MPPTWVWYQGGGGGRCNVPGFLGRLPVAELWTPGATDFLRITTRAPRTELREGARASSVSMAEDVSEKLLGGRITIEELVRALPYSTLHDVRHSEDLHGRNPEPAEPPTPPDRM